MQSTPLTNHLVTAWSGPTLLILDAHGSISDRHPLCGLYFREARHLSRLRLLLCGEEPPIASLARIDHRTVEVDYLFPPVEEQAGGGSGSGGSPTHFGIPARAVDLRVRYRVRPASLELEVVATSRLLEVELPLTWSFAADFADLREALADGERQQDAEVIPERSEGAVCLRYGHRDLPLSTMLEGVGPDGADGTWETKDGSLSTVLVLPRQETIRRCIRIRAADAEEPLELVDEEAREERRAQWGRRRSRIVTPGHPLGEQTERAMEDLGSLALLEGPEAEWLTPMAGVPLYPAFFGRDALTTGWQATALDGGELLRAAWNRVCALQGDVHDPDRDEQPGRLVQQVRRGPLSRLGLDPFGRYYGDQASPLMFVVSMGQLYAWTGDRDALRAHWPNALRVLDWAREAGDRDGDGYLDYLTQSPQGPRHQGWKDSDDAVVDEHGDDVEPPIAMCEIQGYWYAALQIAAALALALGEPRRARRLWREARELRRRFDRDFWLEDEGFLATGLDAEKRPIRSLTSNIGHCLATGIVQPRRIPQVVDRLLSPELFSGWGIRTLSSDNPSFNPLSYHLGTVWPVENSTILFGLRRYGFDSEAIRLARALLDLTALWPEGRIPECVGGGDRAETGHPGAYPHANPVQAWNRSAWPLLVQSILGLQPVAPLRLLAVDPILPVWLPEVRIEGLRVGRAQVDLRFWRDARGRSRFRVLDREGSLRIVRQPSPDALGVGVGRRALSLLGGLWGRGGQTFEDGEATASTRP